MVSVLLKSNPTYLLTRHPFSTSNTGQHCHRVKVNPRRTSRIEVRSTSPNSSFSVSSELPKQAPRTLFPGGYKRPEIKVPNLVLQLSSEEVLQDKTVVDRIDEAVSDRVGIVVLTGSGATGGTLYEAACLLKSVIRDRAYLLIDERVDIAAAVNASGVLLSDQGLPAIVARNMMMGSKSESIILPVIARSVQTPNDAFSAASGGADFLIYTISEDAQLEELINSVIKHVKIPIFISIDSLVEEKKFVGAQNLQNSGISGFIISIKELEVSDGDPINLFHDMYTMNMRTAGGIQTPNKLSILDSDNGFPGNNLVAGFTNLREREQEFIEKEKSVLLEAINVIQKAAPLTEEVSLLVDAVCQLDEPFLLVIVGEFNSGKSTFINALLGKRYLKEGVIPTTNEITFLRFSVSDSNEQQRCERHPDGQYICYLPAPILEEMIIVDTPGTNVILQRQQRLTEEFVPRADLLLFVMSADRPLTNSEVNFLRYTQQWNKKIVFVLNKSDIYQNEIELEEAIAFVKGNIQKLLNAEHVTLYPVSARHALEEKIAKSFDREDDGTINISHGTTSTFYELEKYLYSFLDGTSSTGIERMRLKLETPVRIAEQLLSSCQKMVRKEFQQAEQDLVSVNQLLSDVKEYAKEMEIQGISWKRQILSLVDSTQARVVKIVESTLRLSNLDLVSKYVFRGEQSDLMPATLAIRNDVIGSAVSESQKLLGDYMSWLKSKNARKGRFYVESFEKNWPSFVDPSDHAQLESLELLGRKYGLSSTVIEDFSASAASKLFEQEIREAFLGTFGGLGAAGLSASLLTSILPTTLEDLLALGLCSAGGYIAVSSFPARRQRLVDKVKRTADALARQIEEAMLQDLLDSANDLENFVQLIGRPYQDICQQKLDRLLGTSDELANIEKKLKTLQLEIQNLHVS